MTLKDFVNVTMYNGNVDVVCIAYFKDTKKYYSFRTYIYDEKFDKDTFDDYVLSLEVKSVAIYCDRLMIDVIEWI